MIGWVATPLVVVALVIAAVGDSAAAAGGGAARAKPAPRPATPAASATEIPVARAWLRTKFRSLPAIEVGVAGIGVVSPWMGFPLGGTGAGGGRLRSDSPAGVLPGA
jgi:hypothetical protein